MSTTKHTTYDPDADLVEVRELVDQRDGFFVASLPVSSDSLARDGEAFDTDRLRGFAEQINSDRTIPVFLSHGRGPLAEDRYGAVGKIGRATNGDIETRDGATLLTADLEIADPDDLAEEGDTGDVEATLRWVRQQFRLGLGAVSVGWQEEVDDRDVPGDAELLEVSVVGIESDTEAQQAGVVPGEAAVRGFDAIAEADDGGRSTFRDPMDWYETTDAEVVRDACKTLERYKAAQRKGGDPAQTYPIAATAAEVRRLFGAGHSVPIRERLETLRDPDEYDAEQQREDVLDRLETIEEHREELKGGHRRRDRTDPVVQACRSLRQLLIDEKNENTGLPDKSDWYEV